MPTDPEFRKFQRKMTTARREMRKAVERFAEIDPLGGHRKEALRLAREVHATATAAVAELEKD